MSSVRDLPRLQRCYKQVILCCEEAGVRRPEHLPEQTATADADLAWMVEESNSTMLGHSTVPAVEGDRVRPVMVMSAGRGGIVDHSLSDLSAALAKRLRK